MSEIDSDDLPEVTVSQTQENNSKLLEKNFISSALLLGISAVAISAIAMSTDNKEISRVLFGDLGLDTPQKPGLGTPPKPRSLKMLSIISFLLVISVISIFVIILVFIFLQTFFDKAAI